MDAKNNPEWSTKKGLIMPPTWSRKSMVDVGVKEAVTDHAQALFSASVELYVNLPYKLNARLQSYQESFESEADDRWEKIKVHDLIRDDNILRALKKSQLEFQPVQIRIDNDGEDDEKKSEEKKKNNDKIEEKEKAYLTLGLIGTQPQRDDLYFCESEVIRYSVHLTHEEQQILHTYFELLAVQTRKYIGGPWVHPHVARIIRELCRHLELSSKMMVVAYNIQNRVYTMYLKKTNDSRDWALFVLLDPKDFADDVATIKTCIERRKVVPPAPMPLQYVDMSTGKLPIYITQLEGTRFARNVGYP